MGEVFPVELQMFVRQGMLNTDDIEELRRVRRLRTQREGFSVLRTAHARRRQMQVENNTYQVATLVSALRRSRPGRFPSVPWTLNLWCGFPSFWPAQFLSGLPRGPGCFGV